MLAEISSEAGQVAQFLIDREIEAPERYSAVQSYRVAMAVLRQQRLFVEVGMWVGWDLVGVVMLPYSAVQSYRVAMAVLRQRLFMDVCCEVEGSA